MKKRGDMSHQPNILWIQTDEQRPDSLSCYGSAWARTPAAARLAEHGTVMTNCVCQSPVCVPSRASQLACRYPHELGALNNRAVSFPFPPGTITFPEVFASAGYQTISFGKRHAPVHPIWRGGDQCDLFWEHAGFTSLADGFDNREHRVICRPGTPPLIVAGTYPNVPANQSRHITDQAIGFLREQSGGPQPFLLRVSHLWPHTPVLAPHPFDSLYASGDIPIRYFDEKIFHDRSRFDQAIARRDGMRDLSADQVRQVWSDYMGLCAYVDSEVDRLLRTLDEFGLTEQTIVLFSADHGKMLGEWGAGEKDVFDSEVWRVPFVWSWPGRIPAGESRSDLCELIDTGPTLLALAGLEDMIPERWRGRNIFDSEAPDAVFGAIHPEWYYHDRPELMRAAIRTVRHRMDVNWTMCGMTPASDCLDGNLFDCQEDPHETVNLWDSEKHASVRDELLSRFGAFFAETEWDLRLASAERVQLLGLGNKQPAS